MMAYEATLVAVSFSSYARCSAHPDRLIVIAINTSNIVANITLMEKRVLPADPEFIDSAPADFT
ncbi:hypothetical protein [Pseudoxanthobacter soli]|uniref:hypothetical protein n=1 Tax=Pseudoxanthobacter soli TaxID=433840 RepID=UPI0015882809|nr:hypothetical protein [Pseudoxanthobacter soli]